VGCLTGPWHRSRTGIVISVARRMRVPEALQTPSRRPDRRRDDSIQIFHCGLYPTREAGLPQVVRRLWDRRAYGVSAFADLQQNVLRPQLVTFDDWRSDTWVRYANEVYRGFDCGTRRCGTLVSDRNPWGHWTSRRPTPGSMPGLRPCAPPTVGIFTVSASAVRISRIRRERLKPGARKPAA